MFWFMIRLFYILLQIVFLHLYSFALNNELSEVVHNPSEKEKSVRELFILNEKGIEFALCTGVFISDSIMLTAHHCYDKLSKNNKTISFLDKQTGQKAISLTSFCIENEQSLCADILLLEFPKNTYNGEVWELGLFLEKKDQELRATSYGYGTNDIAEVSVDHQLRKSTIDVKVHEAYVVSSGGGRQAPQGGDSGGPLIYKEKIIGLYSYKKFNNVYFWDKLPSYKLREQNEYFINHMRYLSEEFNVPKTNICVCQKIEYTRKQKLFSDKLYLKETNKTQASFVAPFSESCDFFLKKPNIKYETTYSIDKCEKQ